MNQKVALLCKLVVFIVCLILVIWGQRNVGYIGLTTMIVGLGGLLGLLFIYNRKYR